MMCQDNAFAACIIEVWYLWIGLCCYCFGVDWWHPAL